MRLAAAVLALIVAACLAAPLYAAHVSGTDPFRTNVAGQVDGRDVLAENTAGLGLGVTPIGPTGRGAYVIGADQLGRDVMARLLYGGRTSLLIAGCATLLCLGLAGFLGVAAGFVGGGVDTVLAGALDLLWAFPVTLLAISLSIVLIGHEGADSLLLPIGILALVFVPYVARPLRAEVLALQRREFIEAARSLGASPWRILRRHVLPHVLPSVLGFAPVVTALALLTEAALSILSVGVQAPAASWGTMLADGQTLIYTRPLVAIAPGAMIMATVLALNVIGEAWQDRA